MFLGQLSSQGLDAAGTGSTFSIRESTMKRGEYFALSSSALLRTILPNKLFTRCQLVSQVVLFLTSSVFNSSLVGQLIA